MRRILLFLMLVTLAACTPQDVESALRFLQGSARVYVVFEVGSISREPNIPEALDRTAAVVQRRLDLAGIDAEAKGYSGETAVIVVQGYTPDPDALIALVTRTGRVEFADLRNAPPLLVAAPTDAVFSTTAHPVQDGQVDPVTGEPYPTVLDGVQVINAEATWNEITGAWDVTLIFLPERGAVLPEYAAANIDTMLGILIDGAVLSEYTAANIGTTLGILIDGRVLSAPTIQAQIGREALISGNFSEAEARKLAAVIGGGILPFPLSVIEVR